MSATFHDEITRRYIFLWLSKPLDFKVVAIIATAWLCTIERRVHRRVFNPWLYISQWKRERERDKGSNRATWSTGGHRRFSCHGFAATMKNLVPRLRDSSGINQWYTELSAATSCTSCFECAVKLRVEGSPISSGHQATACACMPALSMDRALCEIASPQRQVC